MILNKFMSTLRLKIITPKKIALEESDVLAVTAPASTGQITILPRHMNLFTLLTEGIIKIKKKDDSDYLAIGGGYLQTNGQEVNILVSRAYGQDEIDEQLTNKAIEEAKKIIIQSSDLKQRAQAREVLRRSIIDLKLLKRKRKI